MTDNPDLDEAIDILRAIAGPMPYGTARRINALLAKYPERPKLLPCPFCGGEAATINLGVTCIAACRRPGPSRELPCCAQTATWADEADAIAAWNRRSSSPDLVCALNLLKEYLTDGAITHHEVIDLIAKYPAKPASGPVDGGKPE